jgi:hypothetical protein
VLRAGFVRENATAGTVLSPYCARSVALLSHSRPTVRAPSPCCPQGWPRLWVNSKSLIGNLIQTAGSTCKFWVNAVNFTFRVCTPPCSPLAAAVPLRGAVTKTVQGWPKLWANFQALIGIFSQSVGPSLASWADPVQFSCVGVRTHPDGPTRALGGGSTGPHGVAQGGRTRRPTSTASSFSNNRSPSSNFPQKALATQVKKHPWLPLLLS